MAEGSLSIVGVGIKLAAHVSVEARAAIERADKVLYGVADPASRAWLSELNPSAESLVDYFEGCPRRDSYDAWVRQILEELRRGRRVCVAFYGHPGVFVYAGHKAVRQARAEGHEARMLPGISAEDCLFADLGLDPSRQGCQTYEATDFLIRRRRLDTSVPLVLWQVGLVGELGPPRTAPSATRLGILSAFLADAYAPDHEVVIYEATVLPIVEPVIERVSLSELAGADLTAASTLYVPPRGAPPVDREMVARLGIPEAYLEAHLQDPDRS